MKFGFRITALSLCALAAPAQVSFSNAPGRIDVSIAGKPASTFYFGDQWAQPFLHPLRAASGTVITRGYPVEKIAGESSDHIWHHGLWYAHGDINGVDFWRDKGPETTGRIRPAAPPKAKGNTVSGRFHLIAPGAKTIGTIDQAFSFKAEGDVRIVDVRITVHADRGEALKFGDTEEGALGIRFRDEFREDRGASITNVDGLAGTKQVWGKRAAWVDYTTKVGAETLGATIYDHPANPKHPSFWHARNYGLCAANPFGEHDFMKDKTRDGSLTVPKGKKVVFRYRVAIHTGALDRAQAAALADKFAKEK